MICDFLWLFGVLQIKNGSVFASETDTEVIPKLLKFAYDSCEAQQQHLPFPKVGPPDAASTRSTSFSACSFLGQIDTNHAG